MLGSGNAHSPGATMRLTSFTDFGLRALMRLAGEPDRVFTTDETLVADMEVTRFDTQRPVNGCDDRSDDLGKSWLGRS